MAGKKITEQAKQFIRDNWYKLSIRDIAKQLGASPAVVRDWGVKLKLGSKPPVYKQRASEPRLAGKGPVSADGLSFADMVSSVFKTLSEKRAELLGELAALHKLPSDDSGKLAIRLQAVESEESRVSTLLYDVEEIKEELERITGKAEKPVGNKPGDFDDIASLIPFLSQPEQREREGRLAEKVRIAAQLVKNDWQQLFDYGEGDLDCPMLTPEGVLSRSQDEDSTDE